MARRVKHTDHENHERWLVSYADFITLLFAFFVVMFASSQADKAKAKQFSEAVTQALEHGSAGRKVAQMLGGKSNTPQGKIDQSPKQPEQLSESVRALARELESEIASGKVSITMEPRGVVISLQESAFFASGDDMLLPSALHSMQTIASIIRKLPNKIRLEGHTDSVPIRNSRFRSNWELSSARGIAVLDWFVQKHQIPYTRMAVIAYADTVPKASNDTDQDRAKNRRVDIAILTEEGAHQEPSRTPPAGGHTRAITKSSST